VEGLTDVKIKQVIDYMIEFSIGVMCLQETRKSKSDVFVEERGFKIILSVALRRGIGLASASLFPQRCANQLRASANLAIDWRASN